MNRTQSRARSILARSTVRLSATAAAAGALAVVMGLAAASASATTGARQARSFSFALQPSPGIASCLPHAGGQVTIAPGSLNDTMSVSVHGMPAHTGFDLFVIQTPNKPFGVSWYQTSARNRESYDWRRSEDRRGGAFASA